MYMYMCIVLFNLYLYLYIIRYTHRQYELMHGLAGFTLLWRHYHRLLYFLLHECYCGDYDVTIIKYDVTIFEYDITTINSRHNISYAFPSLGNQHEV